MNIVVMHVYYDYNDFTSDDQSFLNDCRALAKEYDWNIVELPSGSNKVEYYIINQHEGTIIRE